MTYKNTLHTGDAEKVGNDEDLPFASVHRQLITWERRKEEIRASNFADLTPINELQ